MGCICSTQSGSKSDDQTEVNKSQLQLLPPKKGEVNGLGDGSRGPSRAPSGTNNSGSFNGSSRAISMVNSSRAPSRAPSGTNNSTSFSGSSGAPSKVNSAGSLVYGYSSSLSNKNGDDHQVEKVMPIVVERASSRGTHHHRRATVDLGVNGGGQKPMTSIISIPLGAHAEQVVAGWPSWLSSVAGDAIQGWLPRRADSFEKLDKIGQGTYSSVYKARDLETGKLVAMKKVRFVNMDPESVRFMAREIHVLRKLDHPNVMKLEGLVTSRVSGSLYLVFEYMEHDLAGLSAKPGNKFTEPQIKCFMQQLLSGLVHCHSRGILHRDIKGSNLLINNDGVLKIGDFGLATFFTPEQKQPLTSRVVTLWYRAPELLLGSTDYGIAVDMWSVGCIVAELFAGKPIMPGRTEVEQMHKIFKLCGSPSESYWKKTKFPHATSFKPSQPYKRRLMEAFKEFPTTALALVDALLSIEPEKRGTASSTLKSEFFTTQPLPCDPSNLPKFPPTKEFDIKFRVEDTRRRKTKTTKGRGPESVRRGPGDTKRTTEYDVNGDDSKTGQNSASTYHAQGNGMKSYTVDAQRRNMDSSSMVHPSAAGSLWNKKAKDDNDAHHGLGKTNNASKSGSESGFQKNAMIDLSCRIDDWTSSKDNGYLPKKNRLHFSGPLVPPGGNLEDIVKNHEKQIQHAVRKARAARR